MELSRHIPAFAAACLFATQGMAETELMREFAVCTGRLSAEVEHAWLTGDPRSDAILAQRDGMVALLASVTDPGAETRAMAYRLDAKVAHKALLAAAHFAPEPERADRLRHLAASHLSRCTALLLA